LLKESTSYSQSGTSKVKSCSGPDASLTTGALSFSELHSDSQHPIRRQDMKDTKVIMAARKSRASSAKTGSTRLSNKRWVASVRTDSTHPPKGLFTRDALTIARSLASKKVSPKGPGSGIRMLTYFINRAGRGLSASRRRELEKAKRLLFMRLARAKGSGSKRAA